MINKRQLIAALVEKTGIKITEDDPAFLLVELNLLMLENQSSDAAQHLEAVTEKFRKTTTQSADDLVAVSNESLALFMRRTEDLKTLLEGMQAAPATAVAPVVAPPAARHAPARVALSAPVLAVMAALFVGGVGFGASLSWFLMH